MKFSKILTVAFVALGATLALSGCIRETFPKDSAIVKEQIKGGQVDLLAKGISRGYLAPAFGMWEHTDFGFPSVNVYNDHSAQIICTNGWTMGQAPAYNRFMHGSWGKGYGANGYMSHHYWYSYYPSIKSCNDILSLPADDAVTLTYKAIARTYRAMFYLDLARHFECLYIPADLSDNAALYEEQWNMVQGLTVPIVTELTDESAAEANPRVTREEMYTFILGDLEAAAEVFADPEYRKPSATDPDLAVVYGLMARAYLWLGGFEDGLNGELPEGNEAYAKASEYANKAIQEFGGAVMTEAEWTDPYSGFNTKASSWMWTLYHSSDTLAGNLHQFVAHMAPEASYGYCPFTNPGIGSKYYDYMSDTDFRKKLIVAPEWSNWDTFKNYTVITDKAEFESFAPYTFFKFRPANGNRTDYMSAGAIAIPLMRCEEMYFIDIETAYHLNGPDAGLTKLMQFMTTYRDPGFRYATQDYLDLIIKHKAIEFWGEGIVMFDMKRLDMGVECKYDGTNYDEQRRFNSEHRLSWWTPAIPEGETQVNQGIPAAQNNPDPTDVIVAIK